MQEMDDEIVRLRRRNQDLERLVAQAATPGPTQGSVCELIKTATAPGGSYPGDKDRYFYGLIQIPGGEPDENQAWTSTDLEGGGLFAMNIGSSLPPEGTLLLATVARGRWVIDYNG